MTTRYQYCWLKVTEVETLPGSCPLPVAAGAELADFAVWTRGGAYITDPPRPPGALLKPAGGEISVMGSCAPCPPAVAAKVAGVERAPAARFLREDPPPPPATVVEGWQLECGSVAHNMDLPPRVLFACHPMGESRQEALDWLASPAGEAWLKGALSCTLLAYFQGDGRSAG